MHFQVEKGSSRRFLGQKQDYLAKKVYFQAKKSPNICIVLRNITKYVKMKEEEPGTKTYKVLVLVLKSVLYR